MKITDPFSQFEPPSFVADVTIFLHTLHNLDTYRVTLRYIEPQGVPRVNYYDFKSTNVL